MGLRAFLTLLAVGGLLGAGWLIYPRGRMIDDNLGPDSHWHPNAEEVAKEVGPGPEGTFLDDRHTRFCNLFKKRYRDNFQAIGAKFITTDRIKAMFAPIIARWDMVRVSVELFKEARTVFGRDYEVDIYETYITAPMRKLGEVRADPGSSQVRVTFDPRFASERPPVSTVPPRLSQPAIMRIGPGR